MRDKTHNGYIIISNGQTVNRSKSSKRPDSHLPAKDIEPQNMSTEDAFQGPFSAGFCLGPRLYSLGLASLLVLTGELGSDLQNKLLTP